MRIFDSFAAQSNRLNFQWMVLFASGKNYTAQISSLPAMLVMSNSPKRGLLLWCCWEDIPSRTWRLSNDSSLVLFWQNASTAAVMWMFDILLQILLTSNALCRSIQVKSFNKKKMIKTFGTNWKICFGQSKITEFYSSKAEPKKTREIIM